MAPVCGATEKRVLPINASAATQTSIEGLSIEEAERRLRAGEGNKAGFSSSRSYARIFFQNAFTPINTILFGIGIALIVLKLYPDAFATAGLVLVNVIVGVFQEGRAKRQLDHIALLTLPQATAIRDGNQIALAPDQVVRGDFLSLQPGDQVIVDGKVVATEGLSLDESLLSGESDLVRKGVGDEVFSGTFCMAGAGIYEAESVGAASLANQITSRARSFRSVRTPLQKEVAFVIWTMAAFVVVLGIITLHSIHNLHHASSVLTNTSELKDSVRASAVIVALVPQGLSFMVTVTYALAAVRMARIGALVQRLNAVESMSHIDVLCVDKTGTLTTNRLQLDQIVPFGIDDKDLRPLLADFAASGSVVNRTAETIASALGGKRRPTAAEVAFDSSRKWSALVFEDGKEPGCYVLGAPDILRPKVKKTDGLFEKAEEWSAAGLRVLLFALAERSWRPSPEKPELPGGLTPLALISIKDELRPDAAATAAQFSHNGIRLKIISGDNPETVASLARQAGFGEGLRLLSGPELEGRDEAHLEEAAEEGDIFGRIAPQHKEALVEALQRRGHYVAMTGDGVNDVPALKSAQVSIAMRSGSPVTRNVSDLVLLQDSFGAMPPIFAEGQRIRRGMIAIIRLFLVRTFAISLVILGAAILSKDIPVTPRQNAVPAVLTVGIPALLIAYWARPGRSSRYLLPAAMAFILPAAVTIGAASLFVYLLYVDDSAEALLKARTAVTMTSTVCGIALIPFVQLDREDWTDPAALRREPKLLLAAAAMYLILFVALLIKPLRDLYELQPLSLETWAVIGGVFVAWAVTLHLVWRARIYEQLSRLIPKRWQPDWDEVAAND
jgi:cation-transporting P-type ATPase E